jgi:hypothetical protein
VVLCDLAGKSRAEAAAALGCAEGTVASRVARGRALLAGRVARRGVTSPAVGALGVQAAGAAEASIPPALIRSTVCVAALVVTGQGAVAVPPAVLVLMKGASTVIVFKALQPVLIALIGVALVAAAVFPPGGARPSVPTVAAAPAPRVEKVVATIEGVLDGKKVQPPQELIAPGVEAAVRLVAASNLTNFMRNPGEAIDERWWKQEVTKGIERGRPHLRFRLTGPRQVECRLNGEKAKLTVSEVVFFEPGEGGPVCLWARDGERYYFANQLGGQDGLVKWLGKLRAWPAPARDGASGPDARAPVQPAEHCGGLLGQPGLGRPAGQLLQHAPRLGGGDGLQNPHATQVPAGLRCHNQARLGQQPVEPPLHLRGGSPTQRLAQGGLGQFAQFSETLLGRLALGEPAGVQFGDQLAQLAGRRRPGGA